MFGQAAADARHELQQLAGAQRIFHCRELVAVEAELTRRTLAEVDVLVPRRAPLTLQRGELLLDRLRLLGDLRLAHRLSL